MVDPILELESLKHNLRAKGIPDQMVNIISQKATRDIDNIIVDAIANALNKAVEAGVEKEAHNFISELRASKIGNGYDITTDSGRTDFSNPPFPMLPWLLKNPKVSKDGTLYKVIPIGSSGKSSSQKLSDISKIQEHINETRKQARLQGFGAQNDIFSGAARFSGDFAAQKAYTRNFKTNQAIQAKTGKPTFRTVTSKQDPNSQWVLPAQDKDMTATLAEINSSLRAEVENAIMDVVRFYTESY